MGDLVPPDVRISLQRNIFLTLRDGGLLTVYTSLLDASPSGGSLNWSWARAFHLPTMTAECQASSWSS